METAGRQETGGRGGCRRDERGRTPRVDGHGGEGHSGGYRGGVARREAERRARTRGDGRPVPRRGCRQPAPIVRQARRGRG